MSTCHRAVRQIVPPVVTTDGAGVKLARSIATAALPDLDPFLLLDHFGSDDPDDYLAGFPMHPHRGIETVTHVLAGEVQHRDSLGHAGTVGAGDVQWMTSGRGILHEEMPQRTEGALSGFQLWVNLPARLKMSEPRYQEVEAADIPVVEREDGTTIRIVAGEVDGVAGPVDGVAAQPTYLDVTLPAAGATELPVEPGHTAFAYLFEGAMSIESASTSTAAAPPSLILLGDGDRLRVRADAAGARFLLVSGAPLGEPIARYGPFVMNTKAEIEQTLRELRDGTFARQAGSQVSALAPLPRRRLALLSQAIQIRERLRDAVQQIERTLGIATAVRVKGNQTVTK
jgi:redox-sensitive bicupin YhaK (pirin superfamily)